MLYILFSGLLPGPGFGGIGRGLGPGVFMGMGQRLVPEGAPGAENHNNQRAARLAGTFTSFLLPCFTHRFIQ